MRDFIDKTSTQNGTPINRDYLMALQGFDSIGNTITISGNKIEEYNPYAKRTITFIDENRIEDVFEGEKMITKETTFEDFFDEVSGENIIYINEVVS